MPIHNLGYRPWDGERTSQLSRWWIIAETGIRIAAKSRWVKRMLFFAWLPVLYWGLGFFFVGQSFEQFQRVEQRQATQAEQIAQLEQELTLKDVINEQQELLEEKLEQEMPDIRRKVAARTLENQFGNIASLDQVVEALNNSDAITSRRMIWNWLLMTFFRYPQGALILVLVGVIAPSLIARDIRSRAFLMYFSRPIGRVEYIAGKIAIPAMFMIFVTTLPAMFLYFFGIVMSPDVSVFWSTWDIPFRILAATFVLVLPTASLALMLSSLTQESRFASFAWFAVWTLGHGAWFAIVASQAIKMGHAPFDPLVMESAAVKQWGLLSLYNNLGNVQSWIFGFTSWGDAWPGAAVLLGLTLVSLFVLFRRVSAPIRV